MVTGTGTRPAKGIERGRGECRIRVVVEDRTEDGNNSVVTIKKLGTEPSDTLDSGMGMEHFHPILSMLGGHVGKI